MRRNPNIIRPKPPIKPQQPLLPSHLPKTVPHPRIHLLPPAPSLLLQPCLHKIKRQAEETGKKPRHRTRAQRLHHRAQLRARSQLRLRLAEESQLPEIQRHGADDSRGGPGPEGVDAFGLGDPAQGIDDGAVVRARGDWFQPVGLHADEGQVGRVAHHGCQPARAQSCCCALAEPDLGPFGLGAGFQ